MTMVVTAQEEVLATIDKALRHVERPLVMERSVKAFDTEWRTGRYLVGFPRTALLPGSGAHFERIALELGAPRGAVELLAPRLADALSVHVGVEPEPGGIVWKLYLEFTTRETPEPGMIFNSVKWRGATWVQSRYWYRGDRSAELCAALIRDLVPDGSTRDLLGDLVAQKAFHDRLIEVDEPGSGRRSLDLNLAEAGLCIADKRDELLAVFGAHADAGAYLEVHSQDIVSHIAAGTARDGRPFTTLYHGTRRVSGELA